MVQRIIVAAAAAIVLEAMSLGNSRAGAALTAHRAPSDSEEVALGAALLKQFDADRGVAPSPQSQRIEAYLQRIADSLGRHTKRKLPWHIHYDQHPGIKSGFALPGGHIVIWGGVLAYMSTEDELGRDHRARDRAYRRRPSRAPARQPRHHGAPRHQSFITMEMGRVWRHVW